MLRHYLVLALKVLQRRKFFTAITIFGISFTLLVLMVATSMLDHAFAPGAPELKQDRTLTLANLAATSPRARMNGGPGLKLLERHARNLPGATAMTFFSDGFVITYLDGRKFGLSTKSTDAAFWDIYDFTFVAGAPYGPADFDEARRVAVITRSTAARLFGDGPSAVDRTFDIGGTAFRVLGVVEDVSMFRYEPFSDVWIPYSADPAGQSRTQLAGNFTAVALADDRAGLTMLRDEFNSRMARLDPGDLGEYTAVVAPFESRFERFARNTPFGDQMNPEPQGARLLAFLLLLAGLFAIIPIVNLVNLNVSRILERASEIGVRQAFGAPKTTLVGQFVLENVLLTLVAAVLGLLLSAAVLHAINESGLIQHSAFTLNLRVFGYGLVIAFVFGVISGVYPAWRMSRLRPVEALKGGGR